MLIKGIIDCDFVNYKKPCMVIEFPFCNFKCDKEYGQKICQNSHLANCPNYDIPYSNITNFYLTNTITQAICYQGLDPMDSAEDTIQLTKLFRDYTNDPIIIWTGYNENEIEYLVQILKHYKNIIIKFGRYIPNQPSHYDEVLGIKLASPNQYAKKIN